MLQAGRGKGLRRGWRGEGMGAAGVAGKAEGSVGPQAGETGGTTLGRALIARVEAGNPIKVQTSERS